MQKLHLRTREGSISDMHIQHCDCEHCDGLGILYEQGSALPQVECPACEGMGFLEPVAQEAYETYLNDLYKEVVREMPASRRDNIYLPKVVTAA